MKKQFPPGRIILICLTLLVHSLIRAQMLTPTVIASSGAYATNANGSLSYTIGEMTMVQTFSNANNILTQGFQQPEANITGLIDMAENPSGSFIVYPNPAVDNLWYGFQFPASGRIAVELFNVAGQKLADVYEADYAGGKTAEQINTSSFAAGSYLLHVQFTNAGDGSKQIITKKFLVIR